jgi:hypothetical protein
MNQFASEPNSYLTEKLASAHFYERLQNLITRSAAFVALRGGAGTVTESRWSGTNYKQRSSSRGHSSCWGAAGRL